jgi:hypothetical protein
VQPIDGYTDESSNNAADPVAHERTDYISVSSTNTMSNVGHANNGPKWHAINHTE